MSWLDRIERLGNALPDPITLFALGALGVMLVSDLAVRAEWTVYKHSSVQALDVVRGADGEPLRHPLTGEAVRIPRLDVEGRPVREIAKDPVRARSLLSSEGLYFAVSSLVENFKNFPPLAVVLVGMLGIGLADRTGFIAAMLRASLVAVPGRLLTPAVFAIGVLSSLALDAGYVVLPPIAAALYAAVGRSPAAGLAAVFAGVAAGFSANLMVTSLDTILAGFSEAGARLVDPDYRVAATANLWFLMASTGLLTIVGWATSAWWVEPRLAAKPPDEGGPLAEAGEAAVGLSVPEKRALWIALVAAAVVLLVMVLATRIPGAPLHGMDGRFPRWVSAVVPLLFIGFLVPGIAYGIAIGAIRSDRDAAKLLGETMAGMGPYIALAFFAAQFIEYFRYSGLGEMLAIAGGGFLARADLPAGGLVASFVVVVAVANLLIGSMSAKYAFFAPVFVPMFMQVGISPELTQAAYRVGDSVTNVITPLNPYLVIILAFLRRYVPRAGLGTLLSMMIPYALAFAAAWLLLLLVWVAAEAPLGPGGPLFVEASLSP
ncbi:MAG: AbgT family transporter [Myxococcales bacterium]|nr:AbgT family transporter [Myxococcales bacterium]